MCVYMYIYMYGKPQNQDNDFNDNLSEIIHIKTFLKNTKNFLKMLCPTSPFEPIIWAILTDFHVKFLEIMMNSKNCTAN